MLLQCPFNKQNMLDDLNIITTAPCLPTNAVFKTVVTLKLKLQINLCSCPLESMHCLTKCPGVHSTLIAFLLDFTLWLLHQKMCSFSRHLAVPQRRFWATTFAGHCCSGCTMMAKLQRCLAELASCGQGIPFQPRPILFWTELTCLFHSRPKKTYK